MRVPRSVLLLAISAAASFSLAAPQVVSSHLIEGDEPGLWQGSIDLVWDQEGESLGVTTRNLESYDLQVRLRQAARLYVTLPEDATTAVGVFMVLVDRGSDGFASFSTSSDKPAAQCDEAMNEIRRSSGESGGAVAVEDLGGWIYYSMSDDDPLRDRLDGVYSVKGRVRGRHESTINSVDACGESSSTTSEHTFSVPFAVGLSEVGSHWETMLGNAESGVTFTTRSVLNMMRISQQMQRDPRLGQAFDRSVTDREVRRLANENMSGTFQSPQQYAVANSSGTLSVSGDWSMMKLRDPVEAVLTAVDQDEGIYGPRPDDRRTYRLQLRDPGVEEVEAVRFTLEEVSEHSGVATNGGYHMTVDGFCPYVEHEPEQLWYSLETGLGTSPDGQSAGTVTRHHRRDDPCEVDTLPDVFFTDVDNPDFKIEEPFEGSALRGDYGLIATAVGVTRPEIDVIVAFMDGAASARLKAEVQIEGAWYPAKAEGATADLGTSLLLPLDRNDDGIQDSWQQVFAMDNPDWDNDDNELGEYVGDGLTAFEEYRGVYAEGDFTRTHPTHKTVFVYDDSGLYGSHLSWVRDRYADQELELIVLDETEHYDEIVNNQRVAHRGGDQYVVVVMDAMEQLLPLVVRHPAGSLRWADVAGVAAHVGPPRKGANTTAMDYPEPGDTESEADYTIRVAKTLAHEIGHQMNVSHHGNHDDSDRSWQGRSWVALRGGQHSGNVACFMTYRAASWACGESSSAACSDAQLSQYPAWLVTRESFCSSPSATGHNTLPGMPGDASTRGCLSSLDVRSW